MRNKSESGKFSVRAGLTRAGIFLACMALFMLASLMLADIAIKHPAETDALKRWMENTRHAWLAWRLMLYTGLAWGLWKIHRAPGFRAEYRRPLIRLSVVSAAFILLCEYALFTSPGVAS